MNAALCLLAPVMLGQVYVPPVRPIVVVPPVGGGVQVKPINPLPVNPLPINQLPINPLPVNPGPTPRPLPPMNLNSASPNVSGSPNSSSGVETAPSPDQGVRGVEATAVREPQATQWTESGGIVPPPPQEIHEASPDGGDDDDDDEPKPQTHWELGKIIAWCVVGGLFLWGMTKP